jgi:hypothetical protein
MPGPGLMASTIAATRKARNDMVFVSSVWVLGAAGNRQRHAGQGVGDTAIAIAADHLRDDHQVAGQPLLLALLGGHVGRVLHQCLQRLACLPLIDVRDRPAGRVLPALLAQVTRGGAGAWNFQLAGLNVAITRLAEHLHRTAWAFGQTGSRTPQASRLRRILPIAHLVAPDALRPPRRRCHPAQHRHAAAEPLHRPPRS